MTCHTNSARIGGEFEFNLQDYAGAELFNSKKIDGELDCLWTDVGRSALLIAALAILHRGGKRRAWIPAYSCASISQPFLQAGFEIEYYPVGPDLTCVAQCLPQPKPGDTLLFVHYFGHHNGPMSRAAKEYRAAGVIVVEDCVQGSLMRKVGDHSDFAVTSFRKQLPLPDGAQLRSRIPVDLSAMGLRLDVPDELFVSARLIGKLLRGIHEPAESFLPLFALSENRLQSEITPHCMSWVSQWMMARTDLEDVISKRRANWLSLAEKLKPDEMRGHIRPLFDSLGDDDVPLGLPVAVSAGYRDNLRRFLAGNEIYCSVHWPLPHVPNSCRFENERRLESSILTLPVDQRMSIDHVNRVADGITSFFETH
jgi:hypothetical protein